MSMILSVYSKVGFKEWILPPVNNTEMVLNLDCAIFGIRDDFSLHLEIMDGKWRFVPKSEKISIENRLYTGEKLHDKDSFILDTANGERIFIMVREEDSLFSVFDKYDLHGLNEIAIGSGKNNEIYYSMQYGNVEIVTQIHATLKKDSGGWSIIDQSKNGVFLNDRRITQHARLKFGDKVSIWGLYIVFLGEAIAMCHPSDTPFAVTRLQPYKKTASSHQTLPPSVGKEFFHRAPRILEHLDTSAIEIEAPPSPREVRETPLFMLVGPAFTMMLPMMLGSGVAIIYSSSKSIMMYSGLFTAFCSVLVGIFWALTNVRYSKETAKKEEKRRFEAYSAYLIKCSEKLKAKYLQSVRIWNAMYASVTDIFGGDEPNWNQLWGRNRTHDDFLYHRIGLGDREFQVPIEIPKERFTLVNDSLSDKPEIIREKYKTLHDVPLCVDLWKQRIVGVIGGEDMSGAVTVVQNLIGQIMTQNCYTDVKLALIAPDEEMGGKNIWGFMRNLPHVWSENKRNRFLAMDVSQVSDVCFDLTQVLRQRSKELDENHGKDVCFLPHYILIVEDEKLLEGELLNKYIYDMEQNLGLTTILMAKRYEDLSNACELIIQNDRQFKGFYGTKEGRRSATLVNFDMINMDLLQSLSVKLANLEVNETKMGGEIPNSVDFLEMYGVTQLQELNIAQRWKKNRTYESMKALIGLKSGGQDCFLDLHEKYHGPHGLVAGTTGSGKSESLQTYLLSLAINFSPDDIGLFIIDYKGGGMGNLFANLPHTLGNISNLSGNQVRRAMVSIKSENLRRQRLFNENGVNNINAYTRLFKSKETSIPIPHLFIVIDEFAELKKEEPDFMRELISVAQVGRSLGVHLILATQKPSGTVDDNIWSNSKFRLCLRVQDRQDSMDMLHKPDAAYLTGAGRGYLQVGNDEVYEQFQSGFSGAEYDEELGNAKQVIARLITDTGRTALTGNYLKTERKRQSKQRWIERLCTIADGIDGDDIIAFYQELWGNGLEYAENDYNTKLLRNFLQLKKEAVQEWEKSQTAQYILQASEQRNVKLPEIKEKTQLNAIVEYMARLVKEEGYRKQQPLWLPVLSSVIPLKDLEGYGSEIYQNGRWQQPNEKWELSVKVGFCDDPVNQYQMPLELNFSADGNHAVCGIAMSGKSTFLQTTIYSLIHKYSPEYVQIYILDFSNRMLEAFENDAHVGGILYENDLDTIGKFFHMIQNMIRERKEKFKGGNYHQYVQKCDMEYPAIVIAIDNMANFREKTQEQFDDALLRISRECTANGIYLLLSGAGISMHDIPGRLAENIHRMISLEMQDKFAYSDILKTMQIPTLPEAKIAGRGLALVDGAALEFQTCVAKMAEDDYTRMERIQEECAEMSASWDGKRAKPIPFIPKDPTWSEFYALEEVQTMLAQKPMLPFGYRCDTASIHGLDLRSLYCYLITGRARTGKTNLLRLLMRMAKEKQGDLTVVEFHAEELSEEANTLGARYIQTAAEFKSFIEQMIPVFQERNALKKEYKKQALDEEVYYQKMSEHKPYFIFIADLWEYVNVLHDAKSESGQSLNLHGAMTNLQEKGNLLNIYLFAAMNWERKNSIVGQSVFESFVRYKTGIHLGGNADTQNILEFPNIHYRMLSAKEKTGYGLTGASEGIDSIRVVTPFAGR